MKKFIRFTVAVCMFAALALAVAACGDPDASGKPVKPAPSGSYMQGENDFFDDGIDRDFDFSDFDIVAGADFEKDTGELVDHVFEAETLLMSNSGSGAWKHSCLAKSFHFDPGFGGNICLKNFNAAQFKLTVECDRDVNVPVVMGISNEFEGKYVGADKTLGDYMSVTTQCGKVRRGVKLDKAFFPEEGTPIANNGFFNMVEVTFDINLGKGVNEIVLTGNSRVMNWDYINIRTSALLGENTTKHDWFADGALGEIEIDAPQQDKAGKIVFVCKSSENNQGRSTFSTLPSITDGVESGFYRVGDGADEGYYFMTIAGKEIKIKPYVPQPYVPEEKPTGESLGHDNIKGQWDFYKPEDWRDFTNKGDYGGGFGKPTAQMEGDTFKNLTFNKAARFELFFVQGGNDQYFHIADNKTAWGKPDAQVLFGQEFMYETEISSTGSFMLEIFGTAISYPQFATKNRGGLTFLFEGSSIKTSRYESDKVQTNATVKDAEGNPVNLCDGTKHTLSFCVVRKNIDEVEVRLFVDGEKVMFEATADYLNGAVTNGTMLLTDGSSYGQRLGVVPMKGEGQESYSEIKIYSMEIYKIAK